jgi:hypothetical protein
MIDGMTSRPFSAVTLPEPEMEVSFKQQIMNFSRTRYSETRKKENNRLNEENAINKKSISIQPNLF